ncbi:hypothetical protein [Methanoculleus sp. MH98A]|uniref:hypothetical protein n=1 Tax=Methanoculleus sp. MH98A TaxID=1495314 RepID=UPI00049FA3B2|nr:hypothetical protein [Methanoculleus sp. MH98A]KDE55471.1 hypothetical protein EI28_06735 [Methanoculleus sp. MH98A]
MEDEIAREEQRQSALLACDGRLHVTGLFILAAVLVNLLFLLLLPRYMLYWIASSFILYMVNPFILMIPTGGPKTAFPDWTAIVEFLGSIRGAGWIFSFFPVYLVQPDVGLILDRNRDAPRSVQEPGGGVRKESADRSIRYESPIR